MDTQDSFNNIQTFKVIFKYLNLDIIKQPDNKKTRSFSGKITEKNEKITKNSCEMKDNKLLKESKKIEK